MTLFSVVIPTYNRRELALRCLHMLRNQRFTDFEVIVVDDGSTDGTLEALESFIDLPITVRSQSNAGPATARNLGASTATGDYLVFLDSDDEITSDWLATFSSLCSTHRPGIISCSTVMVDPVSGSVHTMAPRRAGPAFHGITVSFLPAAYAVRRTLFEAVHGFDSRLRYGEHTELGFRLATRCVEEDLPIVWTNLALVVKNHDRSPTVSREYAQARLDSVELQLALHEPRLMSDPNLASGYFAVAAVSAIALGRSREGRRYFWRAITAQPYNPKHYLRFLAALTPITIKRAWGSHV